jgi:sugar O-acyltransferase (sialic acid O-acetyltransferase NeuD family)
MMTQMKAVLAGVGGFGREVICWARDAAAAGTFPELVGYLNDNSESLANFGYKLPYLGEIKRYIPNSETLLIVAIADPAGRRLVTEALLDKGSRFATLIHPSAVVARSATIGVGTIVCPHALVSADAKVGNFVIVNANSSVGHDVCIGSYCTLSAHVDITGGVIVGEDVFFGSGVSVVPHIRIGKNAKIGIGAVVVRSVADGGTMYADPARKL